MTTLESVTVLTDVLIMALALFLSIFLSARASSNRLAFRAIWLLFAVAFYYFISFTNHINPFAASANLRTAALLIGIVATHNLTYLLLPERLQKKTYWIARGVVMGGIVAGVSLILTPVSKPPNPVFINRPNFNSPSSVIINLFYGLSAVAIIYNLVLIFRAGYRPLNFAFYLALFFGMCAVVYSTLSVFLDQLLPRLLPNIFILIALLLISYSILRYQVLIHRRVVSEDFPVSAIAIFGITLLFVLATALMGLPIVQVMIICILVITTFSAYDLLRQLLNRLYNRREENIRRQVFELAQNGATRGTLESNLEQILSVLVQNLQISRAFIAIHEVKNYRVVATSGSYPIKFLLPAHEVEVEELTRAGRALSESITWLVPAYFGEQQLAVLGIGDRAGLKEYTRSDFHWMEDIADHIAQMIFIATVLQKEAPQTQDALYMDAALRTTITSNPNSELIKEVEAGLKNLHDYFLLGKSPLADMLAVPGATHIDRGHAVHDVLVQTIDSLRPDGSRPVEPLPRIWYNFVILHDAYVEDINDREIMARLYISEGTYYRTRRRALRGLARALTEANLASPGPAFPNN